MTREEAYALLCQHVEADNLRKHCLATEAIMRALARRLSKDEEFWGITGLLHDLDFATTADQPAEHTKHTLEVLSGKGFPPEALQAIREHNAEALGIPRSSDFGIALSCAETITGLIVATALVYPDKKLSSVKPKSIHKRMQKKDFARAVSREIIAECGRIGVPLDDFVALSLDAMRDVAEPLGL